MHTPTHRKIPIAKKTLGERLRRGALSQTRTPNSLTAADTVKYSETHGKQVPGKSRTREGHSKRKKTERGG